ncbi:hypothetical protein ACOMHN_031676 [Nucella lapillus]
MKISGHSDPVVYGDEYKEETVRSGISATEETIDLSVDWGFMVRHCLGHLIVLVGLVGNCLSFVVMKAKPLRHKSYSHYLCALAVFDSIVLMTRETHHLDNLLTYFHHPGLFSGFSTPACKMFRFAETLSCLVSSWMVVAMALERLLVVYRPFRKNVLCTQKGALVVITSIFVISSYTQVFRLVMVVSDNGKCLSDPYYEQVYMMLHIYVYQIVLAFLLPVIVVFICNVSVLKKIYQEVKRQEVKRQEVKRQEVKRQEMKRQEVKRQEVKRQEVKRQEVKRQEVKRQEVKRQEVERTLREDENSASTRLNDASSQRSKTTRLLLAIGFVFVFTLLPSNTLSIIIILTYRIQGMGARHLLIASIPWNHLLATITDINYAANFYIYVLSGNKFRQELRRVLRTDRFRFTTMSMSTRATREEFVLT